MKISLDDIQASPKQLSYTEEVGELNAALGKGVPDYRVARGLQVDVEYHRAGLDVFLSGALRGEALGCCSRCAEEYGFSIEQPFQLVLTPRSADPPPATRHRTGLTADEMALNQYEGAEIDLTPLVYEQLMLTLPTRPLCREDCRGLCARCGANLNTAPCHCPAAPPDPRLALLHGLMSK